MLAQVRHTRNVQFAEATLMLAAIRRRVDVLDVRQQVRALVKVVAAETALEATHSAVRLLVAVEMARVAKRLAARRANILLLLLVHHLDVALQIAAHLEARRADRARVLALLVRHPARAAGRTRPRRRLFPGVYILHRGRYGCASLWHGRRRPRRRRRPSPLGRGALLHWRFKLRRR